MDIFSSKKKARHAKVKEKTRFFVKNKKLMIALIAVASVLLIALIVLLSFVLPLILAANESHDDDFGNEGYIETVEKKDEKIYNIALFGIDTRTPDSYSGLSDSIMILSIDTKENEIKLISLMRDTLVTIKRVKNGKETVTYNKLNAAYSLGGPELAVKTINENFGLDISEYATVNFYGMSDIIDAVGGIEIDVQQKEINAANGLNEAIREQSYYLGIKNPPLVKNAGLQKLSGIQAVAWARIRSVSTAEGSANDYGRTDRQRVVMEALLKEALSQNLVKKKDAVEKLLGYCKTSLSFKEMMPLATTILTSEVKFSQTRVPQNDYVIPAPKINGIGSCVYFNLDFAKDIIHSYLYDNIDQETYLENNEIVKKGWYTGPTVSQSSGNGNSNSSSPASSSNFSSSETSSGTSSTDSSSHESSADGSSSVVSSSDESASDASSGDEDTSGSSNGNQGDESGSSGSSSVTSSGQTGGNIDSSDSNEKDESNESKNNSGNNE